MAKKKENLSNPFVPAEEQPYKIPNNWYWVHLLDSFDNYTDSKKKVQSRSYLANGKLAVVDQGQELIGGYTDDENMAYSGKLPVIIFGDHTRCVKYVDFPFAQGADGVKVLSPKLFYDIRTFYFALQSVEIPNMGYRRHYPLFSQFVIPVPPLSEQKRIVARIESLFAKLDEAKEKAQAVLDGFELRKSAILHKAFKGELTERWRREHGVELESWSEKEIGDIAFVTKLAGFEYTKNIAPSLCDGGIPLFKGKNVQQGELVLDFESYIPEKISDELPRSQLSRKCLLVPYVGTIGNVAIFNGTFKAHLGSNVGKIEIHTDTFEEYVFYYLRSDFGYCELTKQKKATAQESISIQAIREVIVKLPTLMEQKELVHMLDSLLEKERQSKAAAESVLVQIDIMKKSILARAFRGELGTNDPAEEWAGEMVGAESYGGKDGKK